MALFSGGRYLRAALKEAGGQGESFWTRDSSPVRPYSIDDSYIPPRSTSRPSARSAQTSASETNTAPTRSVPPTQKEKPFPTRLPPPEPNAKVVPGLQFFSFPGSQDGEDIKALFKARIAEAEILLTAGEKDDIVREAQHIFTYMLQLVNQLDAVMGGDLEGTDARGRPLNASRDSVSVAKERMSRQGTEEKDKAEAKDDDGEGERLNVKSVRKGSFLSIVSTPLANAILFQGRIPTLDQVIRRFSKSSRSSTPQVTFVDEAAKGEKEGGECKGQCETVAVVRGSGRAMGGGVVMPVLAVLLLVGFWVLYKLK